MYTLGGTPLLTYHVRVSECLGILDFPRLKQIPVFDYFDKDGEECHTDTENIVFEPREFSLSCFYYNSAANFVTGWATFLAYLKAQGKKTLVTPYGSFSVYVQLPVEVVEVGRRLQPFRAFTFRLKFTESIPAALSAPSITAGSVTWGIDGYDLYRNFGIRISTVSGVYDLAPRKRYPEFSDMWTSGEVARVLTKHIHYESRDIRLTGYIRKSTDADMITALNGLKWLLWQPGKRTLTVPGNAAIYRVWCKDGAVVTRLTTGVCEFSITMRYINNIEDPAE